MKILERITKLVSRVPAVGDIVWWAPKRVRGIVVRRQPDGQIVFQGGETVKNARGRQLPRWTVSSRADNYLWHPEIHCWVLGAGPIPKAPRADTTVITPKPVQLSGSVTGSFARKER